MNKDNKDALDEINKGCCMGIDSINFIEDKVEGKELKKELEKESKDYKKIIKRIEKIYNDYSDKEPHSTNIVNKTMTKFTIDMETMKDNSDSKITQMLLNGVNMGIIEGRKILNNKNINDDIRSIISDFVTMQEESVEQLKTYL